MWVAPRAGAWIEISCGRSVCSRFWSLPVRERGLKFVFCGAQGQGKTVAPRAGAWIEMYRRAGLFVDGSVAPRAGAWIEMYIGSFYLASDRVAPRAGAWIEIGNNSNTWYSVAGRSPCGSVD